MLEALEPSPTQTLPRYGNYWGLDCEGLAYERGHWRTSEHAAVEHESLGGRGGLSSPRLAGDPEGGFTVGAVFPAPEVAPFLSSLGAEVSARFPPQLPTFPLPSWRRVGGRWAEEELGQGCAQLNVAEVCVPYLHPPPPTPNDSVFL